MDFSIMFFASQMQMDAMHKYRLIIEATKFADQHGFCAVWTPERHFADFGGIFPNPSVISAGLETITQNINIRAGSVVSPLHDSMRIAEEWAVVDNLSQGRVSISFAPGWNINDFIFFPERFEDRRNIMHQQIVEIQDLWQGKSITRTNSEGVALDVLLYPRPIQSKLPIWLTSASASADTFVFAGSIGANILTHLVYQDIGNLVQKITAYREARAKHGYDPATGVVTLMVHTFLGANDEAVKEIVRPSLREYLRSSVSLTTGTTTIGHQAESQELGARLVEELHDMAFERYYNGLSLLGTPEICVQRVRKLEEIGVN